MRGAGLGNGAGPRRGAGLRRGLGGGRVTLVLSVLVLALFLIAAVLSGWIAPADPNQGDLLNRLAPPSGEHLLGTDEVGRDVLSRLIYGARVSLLAGLQAVAISAVFGIGFGLLAGYVGGRVDAALSRINDVVMSLPGLILAIAFVAVLGASTSNAMVAVGIVFIPRFFRVTRAATMDVREQTFIEGLVATGVSPQRIVLRHVLPNISTPLIVEFTIVLSASILAEASLSFLGLATQPPTASWGSMLTQAQARPYLGHLVYPPGIALTVTILALTVVGDRLGRRLANRGVVDDVRA